VIFTETCVAGVFIVDIEPSSDERGFFARNWCADEFARQGLETAIEQCSLAFNRTRGTLRGMHYQMPPQGETKLVRCVAGGIHDVIIDLRQESPTYKQWTGVELTSGNRRQLYVPQGCAHGYLTLCDDTEVAYQIAGRFVPAAARGVRWDDPSFGIQWPFPPTLISERDRNYPDFQQSRQERHEIE
jgi:dTDP-4-dehydrorhamnose 3,5-epimerase